MLPKFDEGDFIQNIEPYEGEPERIVIKVDAGRNEYKLSTVHNDPEKRDFTNGFQIMTFEDAHDFYEKVA